MNALSGSAVYWADYFRNGYVPTLQCFTDALVERLLPQFQNLDKEADEFRNKEYERLGSLPGDPDVDMADLAEIAKDSAISWYQSMSGVKQSIINLYAVGLRHLFEQQIFDFVSHAHLRNTTRADFRGDSESIKAQGIDVEKFRSWQKIDELRLVSNTVKHAEGGSSEQLKALRPDLLQNPTMPKLLFLSTPGPVYQPLAGEDVFLTVEDILGYCEAAKSFWNELAQELERLCVE